jgi:hypothetical protein
VSISKIMIVEKSRKESNTKIGFHLLLRCNTTFSKMGLGLEQDKVICVLKNTHATIADFINS